MMKTVASDGMANAGHRALGERGYIYASCASLYALCVLCGEAVSPTTGACARPPEGYSSPQRV